MIDIEHLLELEVLTSKVTPQEYIEACVKVATDPKLPPRGPYGDPVNTQRVAIFMLKLIDELKEIIARKSR